MAVYDQLEVIGPNGEIRFFDLNPAKGILNIGRHPENDIVLESPEVADFHAVLDHRQKPYQLVVVSPTGHTVIAGAALQPNVPHALSGWDTIELDGHSLILVENGSAPGRAASTAPAAAPRAALAVTAAAAGTAAAAAAAPPVPAASRPAVAAGPAVRLAAPVPDRVDDVILTEISAREWVIDVEQSATCQLTVVNGGELVATFDVRVEGVDESWVVIAPAQVNLFEGERANLSLSISPPRHPSSRAGTYHLAIVVTSPNYPGRVSSLGATLVLNPYYDFVVGELSPRQQKSTWRRPAVQTSLPIANKGNSDATYRLDGEDDERGCRFEFMLPGERAGLVAHAEMRLQPDSAATVPIRITPNKRRFLGVGRHNYTYTITTTPLAGLVTPRAVLGQLQAVPLIGPWVIIVLAVLLAAILAFIFRPSISYFGSDAERIRKDTEPVQIKAGEKVTLYWRASPFSDLRIVSSLPQDPEEGRLEDTIGSKTFTPPVDVKYTLVAENLLTRLHATLFSDSWPVNVAVQSVLPEVHFTIATPNQTDTVVRGEAITLAWRVENATGLSLLTNGVEETIPPEQHTGSRTLVPEADTTFTLVASNRYTPPGGGVSVPLTIKVVAPTATPLPLPVIQRFDVQPLVITVGESIRLDWVVTGVETVTIVGAEGVFAPTGTIEVSPREPGQVSFILTASNGGQPVTLQKTVDVLPAPTPSPEPLAPVIEFFTATPAEVVAGNPEASDIKLAWSIVGKTTNVTISGPDYGEVANLPAQGNITVSAEKPTLFVLTAFNGEDLSASRTVQINVLQPTPTPTPEPTPLPMPIIIFSAAADTDRGESPSSVTAITSSDVPSNTRRYRVVAGTWVKFSWTATNAVKVVFLGEDKAPVDSRSLQVTSASTYLFSAINAQGLQTDLFIQVETSPRPAPPVPYNVSGTALSISGPITLTWDYDGTALASIDSFKIYRVTLPSTTFSAIADNVPKTIPLQYGDSSGGCGMAYYVVAVYTDLDGNRRETGPSTNSWYSPACPTPTPEPP